MYRRVIFVVWMCIPLVLLFLPANEFDEGQSLCLSQVLLDRECLGCGITRSVQHAVHLDFQIAWEFNKLIVIVLPLMIWLWISYALKLYRKSFK